MTEERRTSTDKTGQKGRAQNPAPLAKSDRTEDMALSARNQLPGKIQSVKLGEIMAHVVVDVAGTQVESVITRTSAEEMALKEGDTVRVVVKSTEVMIQKG
jgi:molybdopterin-binding protein